MSTVSRKDSFYSSPIARMEASQLLRCCDEHQRGHDESIQLPLKPKYFLWYGLLVSKLGINKQCIRNKVPCRSLQGSNIPAAYVLGSLGSTPAAEFPA